MVMDGVIFDRMGGGSEKNDKKKFGNSKWGKEMEKMRGVCNLQRESSRINNEKWW